MKEVIFIIPIHELKIESTLAVSKTYLIYKVSDKEKKYVLKAARTLLKTEREALKDEYETMKRIHHPALPRYYAFDPALSVPDVLKPVPAVLMEYVEGQPFSSIDNLTTKQLKKYILDLGDALLVLLKNGVLYMDLHPGNLFIEKGQIRIIDFTKAYYYITNPNPSYNPKISYQINQHLSGQQILIQALTNLLLHLPEHFSSNPLPQSLIQLGLHPHSGISFSEFLTRIEREWEFKSHS